LGASADDAGVDLYPLAAMGGGDIVNRKINRYSSNFAYAPSYAAAGSPDVSQTHCIVGKGCDYTAVQKATAVAMSFGYVKSNVDDTLSLTRVKRFPGLGYRTGAKVQSETWTFHGCQLS
jgi:hypothetical protein